MPAEQDREPGDPGDPDDPEAGDGRGHGPERAGGPGVGPGPGGGRERWRGISVVDGRLSYRVPTERSRRAGLRFEPDALVVVEPGGGEQPLPWDDGEKPDEGYARPAWNLHGLPRGRGNWVAFRLTIGHVHGAEPRQVRLPSGLQPPSHELPALCHYLAATPPARPGLADAERTQALVDALAAGTWRRPEPPQEPLAGDRLHLHQAVDEALATVGWRVVDHRPVAGEPRPSPDEVVPAVRDALADDLAERLPDERIHDEIERHLAVGAWPFDALLGG